MAKSEHVEQDTDRRKADALLDEVRREAQREHDERRDDEEQLAFGGIQDVTGDVLNPPVGAKLDRANEQVGDEQHEQQERAHRKVREDPDTNEQRARHHVRPHRRQAEGAVEEQRKQEADDERAEQADVLEHLTERETLPRGFGLRHVLPEEHQPVPERRQEEEAQLPFPMPAELLTEHPSNRAAEDEAGRPARVEDVQIMRAVGGKRVATSGLATASSVPFAMAKMNVPQYRKL